MSRILIPHALVGLIKWGKCCLPRVASGIPEWKNFHFLSEDCVERFLCASFKKSRVNITLLIRMRRIYKAWVKAVQFLYYSGIFFLLDGNLFE